MPFLRRCVAIKRALLHLLALFRYSSATVSASLRRSFKVVIFTKLIISFVDMSLTLFRIKSSNIELALLFSSSDSSSSAKASDLISLKVSPIISISYTNK